MIDEILKREAYENLIEQGLDEYSAWDTVQAWEEDGAFNVY